MREIKNILFRRILYKIPLKFLLILFAIVAIFIASFSNAEPYHGGAVGIQLTNIPFQIDLTTYTCYTTDTENTYTYSFNGSTFNSFGKRDLVCGWAGDRVYFGGQRNGWILSFPGIPVMTSQQCQSTYSLMPVSSCSSSYCQTTYSLIPVSSVDSNYCQTNNLCPSSDDCPDVGSGGFSNVYINDIFHPSAFNIVINIPEEIDWDYAYTANGNNLNIDVVGYNVDYDYINGQYDIQNFKPNSDDLSNIVSSILPLFIPGFVIILFLYFLFKFIKKIF